MRGKVLAIVAIAASLGIGVSQWAWGSQGGSRTLRLDAAFEQSTIADTTPAGDSLGDVQVASGVLKSPRGQVVGRFGFTCTWVGVSAGDVLERCGGWGDLHDGQVTVEGMSRRSSDSH